MPWREPALRAAFGFGNFAQEQIVIRQSDGVGDGLNKKSGTCFASAGRLAVGGAATSTLVPKMGL